MRKYHTDTIHRNLEELWREKFHDSLHMCAWMHTYACKHIHRVMHRGGTWLFSWFHLNLKRTSHISVPTHTHTQTHAHTHMVMVVKSWLFSYLACCSSQICTVRSTFPAQMKHKVADFSSLPAVLSLSASASHSDANSSLVAYVHTVLQSISQRGVRVQILMCASNKYSTHTHTYAYAYAYAYTYAYQRRMQKKSCESLVPAFRMCFMSCIFTLTCKWTEHGAQKKLLPALVSLHTHTQTHTHTHVHLCLHSHTYATYR